MSNKKSRKRHIALAAAVSTALLASGVIIGCGGSGSTDETPPTPTPPDSPIVVDEELSEIIEGNVRVQLLSDNLVRIEQKTAEGFEDRASYYVLNRTDWHSVKYDMHDDGEYLVISTANYTVKIKKDAGDIYDAGVFAPDGSRLWNYAGETSPNIYLPSPSDALDVWYFSDSPRIIPSEYGYESYVDQYLQGWDFSSTAPDFYVFIPDGNYKTFCKDYTSLTGKSEMVQLTTLGYWDSRWYAYSSETALQQIEDYREKGYSIDVLVIDTDWRDSSGGVGYEINKNLFPDMAGFLEECHKLGVSVAFNDHPEPVGGTQNGLEYDEVNYRNDKLTMILSLGLDYWWYDRNWGVSLESCDPDVSVYAFGMYAYQFITDEYLHNIADLDEYAERALIMGNVDGCLHGKWLYASDISAHRYSIQWTGDIGADSNALSQEIYAAIFGGAEVGLPYVSSDIGGHTAHVTDEMYVRWMQYGALSTICRVHCTHANYIGDVGRMPWLFGETAEQVTKNYIGMRYRLLPLYYNLARENYDSGLPIMRRLDIAYPEYVESSRNDQYLLGDDILIAPIAEAETTQPVPETWLSCTVDNARKSGLVAEYYNNRSFSGAPIRTAVDKNIDFDWGTGGPQGVGSDEFSIKWKGKIRIGEKASSLSFYADDSVVVYIDGEKVIDGATVYDTLLRTPVYAAGSEHDIEVRYAEFGGNAHVYMYYTESEESEKGLCRRTVFIPDGVWIDVWTGKRYSGPQTITVEHALTTSPIFVREGAVLALARDMQYTGEKDWSELALDVYPGKTERSTTLYEDDTTSQAYKDGHCRKTNIVSAFDAASGTHKITIGKAEGSFEGERAFTSREWTVRLHAPIAMGALKSVRVNGKLVGAKSVARDDGAVPFAYQGGAPDSRIYTFTFTSDVDTENVIEYVFANELEDPIAPEYDRTALDFAVAVDDAGDLLNLTAAGDYDWAYFGTDPSGNAVRKTDGGGLIGEVSSYSYMSILGGLTTDVKWSDGDIKRNATDEKSGLASEKSLEFTIDTVKGKAVYVIHLSGYMCTAKATVRDRAGNVKTVTFGDLKGKFSKRIVIECDSAESSTLYVTYSVVSGVPRKLETQSRIALSAVYVADKAAEKVVYETATVEARLASPVQPAAQIDLSDPTVADWAAFYGAGTQVSKAGADIIGSVGFENGREFVDYQSVISWSDGDIKQTEKGTTKGSCTPGSITVPLRITAGTTVVRLYTGAFRSDNTVYVYDRSGKLVATGATFVSESASVNRMVEIEIVSDKDTSVTLTVASSGGDNVSLAAVAVLA